MRDLLYTSSTTSIWQRSINHSQCTSEQSEPGRYPRVHIASASRSHCCVRRLGYSCIVYAKHCSLGSEKRLGWRASGNRSGIGFCHTCRLALPDSANCRSNNSLRWISEVLPFEVVRRPTVPCYTRSSKCACIAPTYSYSSCIGCC